MILCFFVRHTAGSSILVVVKLVDLDKLHGTYADLGFQIRRRFEAGGQGLSMFSWPREAFESGSHSEDSTCGFQLRTRGPLQPMHFAIAKVLLQTFMIADKLLLPVTFAGKV